MNKTITINGEEFPVLSEKQGYVVIQNTIGGADGKNVYFAQPFYLEDGGMEAAEARYGKGIVMAGFNAWLENGLRSKSRTSLAAVLKPLEGVPKAQKVEQLQGSFIFTPEQEAAHIPGVREQSSKSLINQALKCFAEANEKPQGSAERKELKAKGKKLMELANALIAAENSDED